MIRLAPSLLSNFPNFPQTCIALQMFQRTASQSLSDHCKTRTNNLKESTPLKKLWSVLPRYTEGGPHTIFHYLRILSPPPYLRITIALCHPTVLNEPPLWHVHPQQVSAGQMFLSLMDHCYPILKMLEHEMFLQPSWTVYYRGGKPVQGTLPTGVPWGRKTHRWSVPPLPGRPPSSGGHRFHVGLSCDVRGNIVDKVPDSQRNKSSEWID